MAHPNEQTTMTSTASSDPDAAMKLLLPPAVAAAMKTPSKGPTKRKQGGGTRLNDEQRLEILAILEQPKPPSIRSVARDFGMNEKSIRRLVEKKDEIRERTKNEDSSVRQMTFRASHAKHPELEERLFRWIDAARRIPMPLSASTITQKATEIASTLGIPSTSFKGTPGWLDKFKQRRGLSAMNLNPKHASSTHNSSGGNNGFAALHVADSNDPDVVSALDKLYDTINNYDPTCVYNMDETALFYRLVPRYTTLLPSVMVDASSVGMAVDNLASMNNGQYEQDARDRVTLMVCCNATGSEQLPVTMIGKTRDPPTCLQGNIWPLPYFQQKNAWVDVAMFNRWFGEVFEPFVRNRTSREVLLVLDDAPGHPAPFERNGIKVVVFPHGVTSWQQPMEMGITSSLKNRYKQLLLKDILAYHYSPPSVKDNLAAAATHMIPGSAGVAFGKPAHLLDAANYINIAWNEMKKEFLTAYFKKADIIPAFRTKKTRRIEQQNDEDERLIHDLTESLANCGLLRDNPNIEQLRHEIIACFAADDAGSPEFRAILLQEINEIMQRAQDSAWPLETDQDKIVSTIISPETREADVNATALVIIPDLLQQIIDVEVKLGSVLKSKYFTPVNANQVKSALFSARRIIQDVNLQVTRELSSQKNKERVV